MSNKIYLIHYFCDGYNRREHPKIVGSAYSKKEAKKICKKLGKNTKKFYSYRHLKEVKLNEYTALDGVVEIVLDLKDNTYTYEIDVNRVHPLDRQMEVVFNRFYTRHITYSKFKNKVMIDLFISTDLGIEFIKKSTQIEMERIISEYKSLHYWDMVSFSIGAIYCEVDECNNIIYEKDNRFGLMRLRHSHEDNILGRGLEILDFLTYREDLGYVDIKKRGGKIL